MKKIFDLKKYFTLKRIMIGVVVIAFHIMHPTVVNGLNSQDFVAFAAHNSVGSTVYVFDSENDNPYDVSREARENDIYSGISVDSARMSLSCYEYDAPNPNAQVVKKPGNMTFAPDPNDKTPARMIITGIAK